MIAVIYARYSSDKQRATSIEDQARNCHSYAERHSLSVLRTYQDEAMSGAVRNRPAYQQMLADANNNIFDVLLVDDLSRLSREDIEMKQTLNKLIYIGVRIVSVSDGYDSTSKGHKIQAA